MRKDKNCFNVLRYVPGWVESFNKKQFCNDTRKARNSDCEHRLMKLSTTNIGYESTACIECYHRPILSVLQPGLVGTQAANISNLGKEEAIEMYKNQ